MCAPGTGLTRAAGWQGLLTFPRVITYDSDLLQLVMLPVQELELLRVAPPLYNSTERAVLQVYGRGAGQGAGGGDGEGNGGGGSAGVGPGGLPAGVPGAVGPRGGPGEGTGGAGDGVSGMGAAGCCQPRTCSAVQSGNTTGGDGGGDGGGGGGGGGAGGACDSGAVCWTLVEAEVVPGAMASVAAAAGGELARRGGAAAETTPLRGAGAAAGTGLVEQQGRGFVQIVVHSVSLRQGTAATISGYSSSPCPVPHIVC